uniref:Phospholipid transfer protein n=1 Tax=Denticeps clupeoides TaxID=299321 RepID=A0AAY4EID1_9TELE
MAFTVPALIILPILAMANSTHPGCKIRITARGLQMLKYETQKFVEEELSNMTMPEMHGKDDNIDSFLNLNNADLRFQPDLGLLFAAENSSISLSFQRRILYWFLFDEGIINASAEGVNFHTVLHLTKGETGRLRISNITCSAAITKLKAKFSGTLGKVYDFIGTFLTTGMRFVLNKQICPILNHAGLVLINSLMDTIPVRANVDNYIGIDYSLLTDPVVTEKSLDMDFRGMFYELENENETLVNNAVAPIIKENDRMIYLGLSEYFFDSGLYSYYKAGIFKMNIANERMPKDLELLLRTTYIGTIMMLVTLMDAPISLEMEVTSPPRSAIKTSGASVVVDAVVTVMVLPPGKPPVQLSSMTLVGDKTESRSLIPLSRFKIYSNQSALESLALIPLQGPLKTMLQISVVPLLNSRTKRGVQIPLADGMDFIEEVVEYHNGFIIIGANLHFQKGLRDIIEGKSSDESENTV